MSERNGTLATGIALAVFLGAAAALSLSVPSTASAQDAIVADGEQPGVRAEITELRRTSGDTVTLRFALVNESGGRVNVYGLFGRGDLREIHLIDGANRKKYMVIVDTAGKCVCSTRLTTAFDSGKRLNLWARFPAPPADVTEVSVVLPSFMPVDAPIIE